MSVTTKYNEYFDIDDNYFPQITDSSIAKGEENDPDFWMKTYPHPTFVEMLNNLEKSLSHTVKKSLWIEGSYGTGKSQCAYALRRMLEAPKEKLRAYWDRYPELSKNSKNLDLLDRLCGHKDRKIVVAYRYASSEIDKDHKFFMAIQESVLSALKRSGCSYLGEDTLKEQVIAWLEDATNQQIFDVLLKNKYSSRFSQRSASEVLSTLKRGGSVDETMENVLKLTEDGLTLFNIDVDRLCNWLRDVVKKNDIKLVFVWDEFSDYFKLNRDLLSGFQKTTELYGEISFFFVPITHETDAIFGASNQYWKKIKDRFQFSRIQLPDNVALKLIGHGLTPKKERQQEWKAYSNELNASLSDSRNAVAKAAKIDDPDVMRKILPLHPMTALILKHISSVFQSNQRSMFDFVKTSDRDVKAFQWFIENFGPEDDVPLLTVDMLWDFFYEHNRNSLDPKVRGVLDGYEKRQSALRDDEKAVLKAILILQALDELTHNQVEILHPSAKNLALVFDGVTSLSGSRSDNLANNMAKQNVLFTKQLLDKTLVYSVESGTDPGGARLDEIKEKVRKAFTTAKGIVEGELKDALSLTPPLRLRFEDVPGCGYITPTCDENFTRKTRELSARSVENWKFKAIVGFASNSSEGGCLRAKIREEARASGNKEIVFIDATSTTLSERDFEEYVDFAANAVFYQKTDVHASSDHANKAKLVLARWRDSFVNGRFVVYYNGDSWNPTDLQGLRDVLQEIVLKRYPKAFDFVKGLTENQLKKTQMNASALCGIYGSSQKTSGVVVGIEKKLFPSGIWDAPVYWENLPDADISQIKVAVDRFIETGFKRDGQVSISKICDMLEENYGFARCNLYSFLTGFLLKEYGANSALRYADSNGAQDEMSPQKLSVALGDYLGGKNKQETFIVKQTPEERAFYDLAREAWDASKNCKSPSEAASAVNAFLNKRGFPLYFLEGAVPEDAYKIAQKFVELCKSSGDSQLAVARKIGEIGLKLPRLGAELKSALASENFIKGAESYLRAYDEGKLWSLGEAIKTNILSDVKERFKVKYHNLWNADTHEEEIRKLEVEYEFVKEVDDAFNLSANSKEKAFQGLRAAFLRLPVSCETLKRHKGFLASLLDAFLQICKQNDLLPDVLESTLGELVEQRDDIKEIWKDKSALFYACYGEYLEGFDDGEINALAIKASERAMFLKSESECNQLVENFANETRRNQRKTKLVKLWREKTETSNPREWSKKYKTPILCVVDAEEFADAKKVFETISNPNPNDSDVQQATLYLEEKPIFAQLADATRRRASFEEKILKTKVARKLLSYETVVEELEKRIPEVYDWYPNPNVDGRIQELITSVYYSGGSQKVCDVVEKMSPSEAKEYLCRLLKNNVTVGLEILANWED